MSLCCDANLMLMPNVTIKSIMLSVTIVVKVIMSNTMLPKNFAYIHPLHLWSIVIWRFDIWKLLQHPYFKVKLILVLSLCKKYINF